MKQICAGAYDGSESASADSIRWIYFIRRIIPMAYVVVKKIAGYACRLCLPVWLVRGPRFVASGCCCISVAFQRYRLGALGPRAIEIAIIEELVVVRLPEITNPLQLLSRTM